MLYRIARFLQFAGLVILPIAMVGNMSERLTVGQMLMLCAVGMVVFLLGWLLQQGARPE